MATMIQTSTIRRSGNAWSGLAKLTQGCFPVITGLCLETKGFHFIKVRLAEENMDEPLQMLKFKNDLSLWH